MIYHEGHEGHEGKEMTLKELILETDWNKISIQFQFDYDFHFKDRKKRIIKKEMNKYKDVYLKLIEIKPSSSKCRIVIHKFIENEKAYYDASGLDESLYRDNDLFDPIKHKEFENNEELLGLVGTPWQEWLSMQIDKDTLNDYSKNEIITHCLWEMTFFGKQSPD